MHQLSTHSPPCDCDRGQPAYLCQSAFLLISLHFLFPQQLGSSVESTCQAWASKDITFSNNCKTGNRELDGINDNILFIFCNKICFPNPNNQVIPQTLESFFFLSQMFPVFLCQLPIQVFGSESACSQEPKHRDIPLPWPSPGSPILHFYNLCTGFTVWSTYQSMTW